MISIHAPLTGSDDWQAETSKSSAISIHAPLTGSDDWRQVRRIRWNISIHAPLTGSDLRNLSIFNRIPNFNPRSPHRERPSLLFRCPNLPYFNPRSPHRERRLSVTIHVHNKVFQSTLPSQGATGLETGEYIVKQISIHAPLTGSDGHEVQMVWRRSYFNPRSPHRERQRVYDAYKLYRHFNPRSPHRERLDCAFLSFYTLEFQSTLPSQGATAVWTGMTLFTQFQSTLPSQGATALCSPQINVSRISIHAPLTGSDIHPYFRPISRRNFNPRSPHRERRSIH